MTLTVVSNYHPAWPQFLQMFKPAEDKADCEQALTIVQILEVLQNIVYVEDFDTALLVSHLGEAGFKPYSMPKKQMVVWFLKAA
jgi:hypothetical protein